MPGRPLIRPTVLVLAAALAAAGCTTTPSDSTEVTATTRVTQDPAATVSGTAGTDPTGEVTATGGATPTGKTGGGSTGGGTGNSGGQSGSGPTITYFRVAKSPSCPAGTNLNPIAGTPVTLEWKTGNVDSVALSIDGPGVYAEDYPPSGSDTINFPCSGGDGDVQKHTYTLTVRNSSGQRTRTLTVTAKVHTIATV